MLYIEPGRCLEERRLVGPRAEGAEHRDAVARDAGRGGKSERLVEISTGEALDAGLAGGGDVLGKKSEGRGRRGPMVDEGNGLVALS